MLRKQTDSSGDSQLFRLLKKAETPGDRIILLGGRTGRDGIGGATGSSKAHNVESLELDGAAGSRFQYGRTPADRHAGLGLGADRSLRGRCPFLNFWREKVSV